jgi:hypothetical protein
MQPVTRQNKYLSCFVICKFDSNVVIWKRKYRRFVREFLKIAGLALMELEMA